MHTILPNAIPWERLSKSKSLANRRHNLQTAYNAASSLNIHLEMDVEEMLKSDRPDWEKVMKDIARIYKVCEA